MGEESYIVHQARITRQPSRLLSASAFAVATLIDQAKAGHGIVPVSMGVAAMVPDTTGHRGLFGIADSALYEAKQTERNRLLPIE